MNISRSKSAVAAITLGCTVFAASGCSIGPNDIPSVRGGVGESYLIDLEFDGAMNLPHGADVMMDGLRVGEVEEVAVVDNSVRITAEIRQETQVPTSVRAIIRQNTLLGDTYVALDRGTGSDTGPYLEPGQTVPMSQTSAPPQLEDTMAVLAYFVNGGSIQKVEDAMRNLNGVMPKQEQVQDLATVVATDLRDLGGDTNEIDRMLNGFDATTVAINDKGDALATMFSQPAAHYWRRVAVDVVAYIGKILPSVGSVYEGGLWMVPMLNSLADAGGIMRAMWDQGPTDTAKLANFLRSTVLPFSEHPSVNIKSIDSAQGDQIIGDMENLLRMLGAVR